MATDTKERILQATLMALSEFRLDDISLSLIAKRVGISKTAIYRHFSSKQELMTTLEAYIDEQLALLQNELQTIYVMGTDSDAVIEVFVIFARFFHDRRMLLPYFLQQSFLARYATNEESRFLKLVKELLKHVPLDMFEVSSMWFFLIQLLSEETVSEDRIAQVAGSLSTLIHRGLPFCEPLEAARMLQLEQVCNDIETIERDRYFLALERVLTQYGPFGISIERVATELGLANSTLYTRFDSKESMIHQTMMQEFDQFRRILIHHLGAARTASEAMFLILANSRSYGLQASPLSCGIISWICLNGSLQCGSGMNHMKLDLPQDSPILKCFSQVKEYGLKHDVLPVVLLGWITYIPFNLLFLEQACLFDDMKLDVRQLYDCICHRTAR